MSSLKQQFRNNLCSVNATNTHLCFLCDRAAFNTSITHSKRKPTNADAIFLKCVPSGVEDIKTVSLNPMELDLG
jgi:hypothetical protein